MSKNYYQENKEIMEQQKKKEILCYWSNEKTYAWLEKEIPNYQLIESIVLKYDGISATSIASLYNKRIKSDNPINSYIVEHIITTSNNYKCTFRVFGNYEKKNDLWYYKVDPTTELQINRTNPYMNEKKLKTKKYIVSLEKKIKMLEEELTHIKAKGVSQ